MAITKKQRHAIKRIFDRTPVFDDERSASRIADDNGWRYMQAIQVASAYQLPDLAKSYDYVWVHPSSDNVYTDAAELVIAEELATLLTYRQFRKTVKQGFDCLMVRWQGMWLGIERDGHVHS